LELRVIKEDKDHRQLVQQDQSELRVLKGLHQWVQVDQLEHRVIKENKDHLLLELKDQQVLKELKDHHR
jgi:hypothetical protein